MVRALYWFYQVYLFIFRPVTFGVRVLIAKGDEVLLVKHTYKHGWHLPGGGIQRNETPADAGRREVREETGLEVAELRLGGVYSTLVGHISGHEILFLGKCNASASVGRHDVEIAEAGFFSIQQLPEGLLPGYRRRIEEYFEHQQAPTHGIW